MRFEFNAVILISLQAGWNKILPEFLNLKSIHSSIDRFNTENVNVLSLDILQTIFELVERILENQPDKIINDRSEGWDQWQPLIVGKEHKSKIFCDKTLAINLLVKQSVYEVANEWTWLSSFRSAFLCFPWSSRKLCWHI